MERLLLASFGVIILAGRLCAADVYYFTAASTSFSTASNFVADQNNTLGTASPAWSLNAGYNVDLINSATALGTKNVDLSANMTVGAFSNTSSAPGGEWIFYSQDSATNTWNFDSITQNSAVNLRFRKRQGATGLVLNITNGISVGKGILWLGHTDNSQQITSLTVGGNTSITSGGTLNIVDHGTANFKDTITNTNGTLSFINNGTAKPTGAQVISVKNIVSNNNSAGSLDIGKIDSYAKYVSTDTANRIMNFNAGDISAENSRNTVSINVDTFRVDSALYEGATGTLRYSAAGTGNRLKMLVQNAYIENFIVGEESGSVKSYVEITRGTDILDYSAAGTFEVGKLTSLYTMGEVRIGYLYLGTDNYANYTKYETIKIGEANISRGMSLVAENIEIGSFTKNAVESGENMDFGKVENGLFAENISIGEAGADGAASESVSTLHDGIVTLYGRSVNIHGTLNLAPTKSNISTELNIGTIRDSEGSILKQSVNIDALNFDTSVAAANARFNANISDLSINDVNFSGGSSAVLYAAADNGAKIGNVSVSTWMNGAVKTKTDKAYIDISGNASIDKISFKGLYTNSN